LKVVHLFFVSAWVGCGLTMLFLLAMVSTTHAPFEIVQAIQILGINVAVPSATGTFITGLIFSITTPWGFFKHRWIIAKYLINLAPMLLGAICLAPWILGMLEQAERLGANVLYDPLFLRRRSLFTSFVTVQFFLLLGAIYLSVFKPRLLKGVRN